MTIFLHQRIPVSAAHYCALRCARDGIGKFALAAIAFFLNACAQQNDTAPTFHARENPRNLSDWGMLRTDKGELILAEGVTPYDLATPLFSDYALKLRTIWTPNGAPAVYNADRAFDFPVGTVITKTFYYPVAGDNKDGAVSIGRERSVNDRVMSLDHLRLIETRILVNRDTGWEALPYLWNEDQTDAVLMRTGAVVPMTLQRDDGRTKQFGYLVPNVNQCAGCHATDATANAIQPIGAKARHLNKPSSYQPGFNQLDHWLAKGLLTGEIAQPAPKNAIWTDEIAPLADRARAYLDVNCSHCHSPSGPADTSGLNLEPDAEGPALGICKTPIAAGVGTGERIFDIVPGEPENSITIFRMETNNPGAMMPELGRAVMHEEGVALVSEWIAAMEGGCD
ncbi:SO2930 family diheme c-type cytochrome [Hyphococcus sp.]|uniref:SO2930 family diheme c-type cytochrome n=1 Tax=Hyphococcus sp. TaxID=2038636 RepID=UPI003CCB9C78